MADDILDIIVRLSGDYSKIEELINNPHTVRLDAVASQQLQDVKAALSAAKSGPTPFNPGNSAAQQQAAQQSLDNLKEQVRQQTLLNGLQNQSFRNQQKIDEANRRNRLEPLYGGRSREEIAFRSGVRTEDITSQRKLFDVGRIAQGNNPRELAFAALFGQGIAGRGANLVGGAAGAALGIGALPGAAVTQIALQELSRGLEVLGRAFEKVTQAGITFERSILGIASVFQATSNVVSPGGRPLSVREQIDFQQGEAKKVQQAARARLLPLGISGEKEATLVQAIISGAAQRGIRLSPDQAATLAERLGGAIQAQRPEILDNPTLLRRDVEDALAGTAAGKRSIVGSIIRGFAPGLFTATSGQEFIDKSKGLAAFPEALKGSNNPVTALNQLDAALDNLATTVGTAVIESAVPGIKALTEALTNPELIQGLASFGKAISDFGSILIRQATEFITIKQIADRALSGYAGSDNKAVELGFDAAYLQAVAAGDHDRAAQILTARRILLPGKQHDKDTTDKSSIRSFSQIFGAEDNTEFGTFDAKNPFAGFINLAKTLRSIPEAHATSRLDAAKISDPEEREKFLKERQRQIARAISNARSKATDADQDLFEKGQKLFGSDLYSRISQNRFTQDHLGNIIEQRKGIVANADDEVAKAREKLNLLNHAAGPGGASREALEEAEQKLAAARAVQITETEKLIKAQNDLSEAVQKSIALIEEEAKFRLSQVNSETVSGQTRGLGIQQGAIDAATRALLDRLPQASTEEERQYILGQLKAQGVQQEQLNAKKELRPGQTAGAEIEAVKALDNLKNSAFEAAKATKEMADSVINARQALEDFDKETKLRDLERKDAIAGAKERYADALDKEFGPGAGDAYRENPDDKTHRDTQLAKERLRDVENKNNPFRTFDQDQRTRKGLELNLQQSQINQTELPYQLASQKIGDIQKVVELANQFPDNEKLQAAAKDAQAQIPELLSQLGFGSAGENIKSIFGEGSPVFSPKTEPFSPVANSAQTNAINQLINFADFKVNDAVININNAIFNGIGQPSANSGTPLSGGAGASSPTDNRSPFEKVASPRPGDYDNTLVDRRHIAPGRYGNPGGPGDSLDDELNKAFKGADPFNGGASMSPPSDQSSSPSPIEEQTYNKPISLSEFKLKTSQGMVTLSPRTGAKFDFGGGMGGGKLLKTGEKIKAREGDPGFADELDPDLRGMYGFTPQQFGGSNFRLGAFDNVDNNQFSLEAEKQALFAPIDLGAEIIPPRPKLSPMEEAEAKARGSMYNAEESLNKKLNPMQSFADILTGSDGIPSRKVETKPTPKPVTRIHSDRLPPLPKGLREGDKFDVSSIPDSTQAFNDAFFATMQAASPDLGLPALGLGVHSSIADLSKSNEPGEGNGKALADLIRQQYGPKRSLEDEVFHSDLLDTYPQMQAPFDIRDVNLDSHPDFGKVPGFTFDGQPVDSKFQKYNSPLAGSEGAFKIEDSNMYYPTKLPALESLDPLRKRKHLQDEFVPHQAVQPEEEFRKQIPSSDNQTNTDIVNTLKQLPAQIGLQMRYALDNSFSGSQ